MRLVGEARRRRLGGRSSGAEEGGVLSRILTFDSGIGGFGIVGALRRVAPGVTVDLLADNAVFPYGEMPEAVLVARLRQVIGAAIAALTPDVVVIACNTASTAGLAALRDSFAVPFVGCVPPIKWAAELSRTRVIGLLATTATVRRPYLRDLQQRFAPDCTLLAHGARGLADLAERVFRGHAADPAVVDVAVRALFDQENGERLDAVCIGCTHYSFLLDALEAASPRPVRWLDPADAVARQAVTVLERVAPDGGAGAGSGRAWFTAAPDEAERLGPALARFGYGDGFEVFAAPEVRVPAGV